MAVNYAMQVGWTGMFVGKLQVSGKRRELWRMRLVLLVGQVGKPQQVRECLLARPCSSVEALRLLRPQKGGLGLQSVCALTSSVLH